VGKCPVDVNEIAAQKLKVQRWLEPGSPGDRIFRDKGLKICFLDGFLLYTPDLEAVMKLLDLKVFLLASRAKAIERRAARDGYVTLEGFWKDPPGYVEKVVWPNYVEAHSWLFKTGDVEGDLNAEVLAASKIEAQVGRGLDIPMTESLKWVVDLVIRGLEDLYLSSGQNKP
jgi:nicotinamide/nicotinate riboside kinase